MRRITQLSLVCFGSTLAVQGCDKSTPVGEVQDSGADDGGPAGDDGSTEGGDDDGGPGDPSASDGLADSGNPGDADADDGADDSADDGSDPMACEGPTAYFEAASCPSSVGPGIDTPGCYVECTGDASVCPDGTTCHNVEVNPCPCPDGGEDGGVCCGACAGDADLCMPDAFDTVCAALVGTRFLSIEELECGPAPKGMKSLCHWEVQLIMTGDFFWMYSDVGEQGTYTCEDGVITTEAPAVENSYDPRTQILTWDGVEYQPDDL